MTNLEQGEVPDVANPQPAIAQQSQYNAPFAVNISFPESIIIKMVDASALHDYEFGLFISSLCASAFVGFLVAFLQAPISDPSGRTFGIVAILVAIIAAAFFIWALVKRSKMTARSKAFKLQTGGVQEIIED